MTRRVYEDWKGRNIFICNGRLMFGPDVKALIVTVLLILVPSVIFCNLVVRNLVRRFSASNAGYALLAVAVLFTIYVLVLLLLTAARDPGIIPRKTHSPEEELGSESSASTWSGGTWKLKRAQFPRMKDVFVNGLPVTIKYCETCMVFRPPRCSHCVLCDNCVERFDHHCPWVGQCIGKCNYRCFFLFVSSTALLCLFVLSVAALHMKFLAEDYGTLWKAMKQSPASVILMAYCFIFLWFVGGLTCFHLYLISKNQTTYENFRYGVNYSFNVYNRGCRDNYLEIFCTKIEPSKINFRAYIIREEASESPIGPTQEAKACVHGQDTQLKVEAKLGRGVKMG